MCKNILELSIFAICITVERQDIVVYIREIMISTLGNLNIVRGIRQSL